MNFVEEMKKVSTVEDKAEPLQIHSEWELLKRRLAKKIESGKETSVLMRGRKESDEPLRQLDLDEMPANRKPDKPIILDDLGPDGNASSMLRQIKAGTISAKQLDAEERHIVVKALKDQGRNQDEIADLLDVSRRTIMSDYKWLREAAAREIKELDVDSLAGQIFTIGEACISRALADGLYRTVSYVMRDMVEMLQSMGIVYRAPQQLRSMQLTGHVPVARAAFAKYMESITGEEDRVIAVLDKMMSGIESGEIS